MIATFARNYFLNDAYDYGVAILADSAATASLSWVAMSWLSQPSDYAGRAVQNYGYPAANQQCAFHQPARVMASCTRTPA